MMIVDEGKGVSGTHEGKKHVEGGELRGRSFSLTFSSDPLDGDFSVFAFLNHEESKIEPESLKNIEDMRSDANTEQLLNNVVLALIDLIGENPNRDPN